MSVNRSETVSQASVSDCQTHRSPIANCIIKNRPRRVSRLTMHRFWQFLTKENGSQIFGIVYPRHNQRSEDMLSRIRQKLLTINLKSIYNLFTRTEIGHRSYRVQSPHRHPICLRSVTPLIPDFILRTPHPSENHAFFHRPSFPLPVSLRVVFSTPYIPVDRGSPEKCQILHNHHSPERIWQVWLRSPLSFL